jgi:hypothetical protein
LDSIKGKNSILDKVGVTSHLYLSLTYQRFGKGEQAAHYLQSFIQSGEISKQDTFYQLMTALFVNRKLELSQESKEKI